MKGKVLEKDTQLPRVILHGVSTVLREHEGCDVQSGSGCSAESTDIEHSHGDTSSATPSSGEYSVSRMSPEPDYERLIYNALQANLASAQSSAAAMRDISDKLSNLKEQMLTREEDKRDDQVLKEEIYTYIREQFTKDNGRARDAHGYLEKMIEDVRQDGRDKRTYIWSVLTLMTMAILAIGGWVVTNHVLGKG